MQTSILSVLRRQWCEVALFEAVRSVLEGANTGRSNGSRTEDERKVQPLQLAGFWVRIGEKYAQKQTRFAILC